jgi:methylthioribulose-1-phosphate dehydratase
VQALIDIGRSFHERGWSFATSSNYSVVILRGPLRLLITASGRDKSKLTENDFVLVGENGKVITRRSAAAEPTASKAKVARKRPPPQPSAETILHVTLALRCGAGAVLHTHSVWSTLLSEHPSCSGGFWIEGYEMLKALSGVETHAHREWIEVFDNTQDMPALADKLCERLDAGPPPIAHGFLVRRHGLYTWGRDLEEARRHVEAFEFLFEVMGRRFYAGAPATV